MSPCVATCNLTITFLLALTRVFLVCFPPCTRFQNYRFNHIGHDNFWESRIEGIYFQPVPSNPPPSTPIAFFGQ